MRVVGVTVRMYRSGVLTFLTTNQTMMIDDDGLMISCDEMEWTVVVIYDSSGWIGLLTLR